MDFLEMHEEADFRYLLLVEKIRMTMDSEQMRSWIDPVAEARLLGFMTRLYAKRNCRDFGDLAALILYDYRPVMGILVAASFDQFRVRRAYESIFDAIELIDETPPTIHPFIHEKYPGLEKFLKDSDEVRRRSGEFLTLAVILPTDGQEDILRARARYANLREGEKKHMIARTLEMQDPLIAKYITR